MSNVLLPILPGNMPQGYCFTTWQQLLVDMSNAQKALLPGGMAFYNYGDTKPAPEYEIFPWLYTVDMRWYRFDGNWISPNPETDANIRRIYVGALTGAGSLEYYDGGSPGTVTNRTGPMWEQDTDFIGRVPIGCGLVPGTTTPAVTVTVGDPFGAAEHTLTEAEGGTGTHVHGIGKYLSGAAGFNYTGNNTVPSYTGAVVQGIGGSSTGPDTTANMFTLPSGLTGAGVTPTPFQTIPPSVGVYIVKRTQRQFYVIP